MVATTIISITPDTGMRNSGVAPSQTAPNPEELAEQASRRTKSSRNRKLQACGRVSLLVLGLVGAIWSAPSLLQFWSAAPAKDITARILADGRFKAGTLNEVLASMQARPETVLHRSDLARADALLRLRIAEEAMGRKRPEEGDDDAAAADHSLKSSLVFNPTDSFLWLMLYSLEIARNGFDVKTVGLLGQSYATAPLDGWIALRRNRLALAAFPSLSMTTQAEVVSEFAGLVDSGFIEATALILMGVGWEQKDRLLASLANVELIQREEFAKRLLRDGLKVSVPGVEFNERLRR